MQKAWLWISGANEASSEKRDCTCIHFSLLLALAGFWLWLLLTWAQLRKLLIMRYMPRGWGVCILYFNHPLVSEGVRGRNGIQQSSHNRPAVQALLGKGPALAGTLVEFSSNSVAPFASFNRSSVGSLSSSTSDFELAHMLCTDGAVTSASLELIKSWNMLDQEEEMWPDLEGQSKWAERANWPSPLRKTAAAWPEVAPMGLGHVLMGDSPC